MPRQARKPYIEVSHVARASSCEAGYTLAPFSPRNRGAEKAGLTVLECKSPRRSPVVPIDQSSAAVDADGRVLEATVGGGAWEDVRGRVLHGEDAREAARQPAVDDAVEHARLVRRIGEGDVVGVLVERAGEGERVALEDAGPVAHAKQRDVGTEGVKAGGPRLDEVGARGAARDGLEAEGTGAGKEVQYDGVAKRRLHQV